MRNRPTRVLLYLCVTTVLAAASAQAQLTTGTVSGRVVDETGAVIPGAVVTLTHDETGFKREMETDAVGSFGFIGLPPGTYTLRIEQSSFRIHETRELEVNVGKVSGLGGIVLQVGSPTEVVTVEAGTTALVQADNPEILGHYDGEVVYDVIAGFFGLDAVSFLTPGIVPGFGNIVTNTGDFGSQVGGDSGAVPAAAGQRGRSTQYSVDGHEINDTVLGGPSISLANLQAIEEYQVSVNSFDASQGRLPGAQINLITKGGTNDLHGAAFWFYEASSLRSKTSAESRFGADKPKAIQQPFGFTLGGPIIKNKWFGFGSYSRLFIPGRTLVQAQSPAFLAADAAGLAAAAGTNSTAFYASHGPFSRPFGNPRCTPGTQTVFADFGGTGLDLNACGVTRDLPAEDLTWAYTLRMDVVTNTAGTFTGRWFDEFEGFCCFGGATGFIGDNNFRGQSLTFGHTYQFSPRAINNFHFSFGRFPIFFRAVDPKADRIRDNLSTLRLPLPLVSFGGLVLPQGYIQNSFPWKDDFSYIRGRHTLKAGLEFRRNRTRLDFLPSLGSFRYVTAAQFVNDTPISTSFALGPDAIFFFETDQFYWLQDDIRLRPNLILNLGLRYEHTGQPINGLHEETLERESNPATAFWLQSLPLEQRTFPRIKSDNNNWGPRIGFAYTPRWGKRFFGEDKTVIRGGYSIAYEASFHNILVNAASAAPRIFSFLVAPGIPIPGDGTGNAVAAAIPAPLNTRDPREEFRTDVPSDFKSPYSQYWSLGLQREFGTSVVAEARYVGNRAIGQFQSVNANPLFTNAFALGLSPPGLTPCPAGSPDIPSSFQTNNSVGRGVCD
ncbi:MAG: TonB-dependent receptor domain-containing protein, partial [Terriglobia bacterium]